MQHGRHGVTDWQQTVTDVVSMYAQKKRRVCQFCTLLTFWSDLLVFKSLSSQQRTRSTRISCATVWSAFRQFVQCVHTRVRAWAFEQQQLFALVFDPFLLYQQCAITLQHDCSDLLPQEAAVVFAEKPKLGWTFLFLFLNMMLFLTLLYAWQHLLCMVSAYITLCWSVCACCCNLRAFLKAETLPVYANYVDWGHLKWQGPITFDKLEILLQPGQNEQLKMSTQVSASYVFTFADDHSAGSNTSRILLLWYHVALSVVSLQEALCWVKLLCKALCSNTRKDFTCCVQHYTQYNLRSSMLSAQASVKTIKQWF